MAFANTCDSFITVQFFDLLLVGHKVNLRLLVHAVDVLPVWIHSCLRSISNGLVASVTHLVATHIVQFG